MSTVRRFFHDVWDSMRNGHTAASPPPWIQRPPSMSPPAPVPVDLDMLMQILRIRMDECEGALIRIHRDELEHLMRAASASQDPPRG